MKFSHLCHYQSCHRTAVQAECHIQARTIQSRKDIPRPCGMLAWCRCHDLSELLSVSVIKIILQMHYQAIRIIIITINMILIIFFLYRCSSPGSPRVCNAFHSIRWCTGTCLQQYLSLSLIFRGFSIDFDVFYRNYQLFLDLNFVCNCRPLTI